MLFTIFLFLGVIDDDEGASSSTTSATSVLDTLFAGVVPKKMMDDTKEILAPEVNMNRAKEWSVKMKSVHMELDTLPRCAKHGTVSYCLFFIICLLT